MSKKAYWSMKDEDLKSIVIERKLQDKIDMDNWNRKEVIAEIQLNDVTTGEESGVIEDDNEGNVKEIVNDPKHGKIRVVKVRFHNTRENDAPYIFLGHNGKSYYVPREQDIYIPKFLLESCIKDAVEEHLVPERRHDGKINYIQRKVQRFPYTELHD